jgi:uncharacterized protein YjdB
MKVKNKSRFFIFTLAILLTTVLSAQFAAEKVHALSYGQEILITEVMPMSQTTEDSYEYIELYNNSDKAIDIKDYKLESPSIDITVSKAIQPRGILVLCTKSSTTLEKFNEFYSTKLTADKFAVLPFNNGVLSNNSSASILLSKDDNTIISRALYNSSEFQVKKSITYKYALGVIDMVLLGQNQNPTPGTISFEQVPQNDIKVTDVTLDKSVQIMSIKQTSQLHATVSPINASNRNLIWSTNDASVATVTDGGLITALKAGTAVITVRTADGGFKDKCFVIVKDGISTDNASIFSLKLNKTSIRISKGKREKLNAIINPGYMKNVNLVWKSSNENVAYVTNDGVVYGKNKGEAEITISTKDGKHSAKCKVRVTEAKDSGNGKGKGLLKWFK